MVNLIGICGFAQVGKDTLSNFLVEFLGEKDIIAKKGSFADGVKRDLDAFLLEKLGISAFTEDPKEKEIIRPLLVSWGTDVMRNIDPDHWIKRYEYEYKDNLSFNKVSIISDLRFENELNWIHKSDGITVWVDRPQIKARNKDEEFYTKPLKSKCKHIIEWPNTTWFDLPLGQLALKNVSYEFFKKIC